MASTWPELHAGTVFGYNWDVIGLTWIKAVPATSGPGGGGDASAANQLLGNASVASIDTKTPALGQALAALSTPVVLTAIQQAALTPPAAIAGFALEAGHLAAIDTSTAKIPSQGQALAAGSVPVVLTAIQQTALTPPAAITGFALEAGHLATIDTKTPALGQALAAAAVPVVLTAIQQTALTPPAAITGFNLEATQLLVKAKTDQLDVALSTRLKPADTLTGVTTVGAVTGITNPVTVAQATPANLQATVTPIALTKGTQGATGFSTQDLKDAGRTSIVLYATAAASGTTGTETAITLTKASGTSATANAVSFVVTSGKRFRIEQILVSAVGHVTATTQATTFAFRINTAGAVTTTSTPIVWKGRVQTPATSLAYQQISLPIPEGYEILGDGTLQIGMTANSVFTTNAPTWDVTIIGYEY